MLNWHVCRIVFVISLNRKAFKIDFFMKAFEYILLGIIIIQ